MIRVLGGVRNLVPSAKLDKKPCKIISNVKHDLGCIGRAAHPKAGRIARVSPTEIGITGVLGGITTGPGDGFQNQGETGIDCGGPCPACECSKANEGQAYH